MELPYKEGDSAPTGHHTLPSETQNTRSGLHLVESLAERAPWNPQTSQAIAKALSYSPQPDGKSPLLETTHLLSTAEKLHPY